jgi:DNA invertase Pin-like site-specific DNA recombinase
VFRVSAKYMRRGFDGLTTTPGGKLVFHVFAALAEFERDLIRERTNAGSLLPVPAAATAAGLGHDRPQAPGGPGDVTSRQYPVAAIAKTLGVSRASIYRHLTRAGGGQVSAVLKAVASVV